MKYFLVTIKPHVNEPGLRMIVEARSSMAARRDMGPHVTEVEELKEDDPRVLKARRGF